MPELPDLVYIEKKLNSILPRKKISAVTIKEPIVIRVLVEQSFEETLKNATFEKVYRHGPFLGFNFDTDIELIIHPMLAGKLKHAATSGKAGHGLCFSLTLDDGSILHYLDNRKMGKVYLIKKGEHRLIPRFLQQGVNILSAEFNLEHFQELIKGVRKQVRVFLMDQTKLSAIGNAYADEILFAAGLHPKTFCYQLSQEEIDRFYKSIPKVMRWGIDEVEKAQEPLEVKVRGHVKVRNRKDEACPNCGTSIRRAGVLGYDSFFCPTCQPPKRQQFIQWS